MKYGRILSIIASHPDGTKTEMLVCSGYYEVEEGKFLKKPKQLKKIKYNKTINLN